MMISFKNKLSPMLFLASALLGFSFNTPASAHQPEATMDIQGEGIIAGTPDMALVTSGVLSQAKTARDALDANNKAMRDIIKVLEEANIDTKDMQTSGFRINPRYFQPRSSNGQRLEAPRIVGYEVANNVTIKVRDLEKLGTLIDKLVTVGSNNVSSIQFTVADPSPLMAQARQQAMKSALSKAKLYSEAAGVQLGDILSINENGGGRPSPVFAQARAFDAAESSVPVQAGEVNFSASVSVRFELEQ